MAAANFSRDVLERTGDLIDFETVIKNPLFVKVETGVLIDFETALENLPFDKVDDQYFVGSFNIGERLYNHCDWLKIGKRERCGKRCKLFYCSAHSENINKGGIISIPCLCCGTGVRNLKQLCRHCERKHRLRYK